MAAGRGVSRGSARCKRGGKGSMHCCQSNDVARGMEARGGAGRARRWNTSASACPGFDSRRARSTAVARVSYRSLRDCGGGGFPWSARPLVRPPRAEGLVFDLAMRYRPGSGRTTFFYDERCQPVVIPSPIRLRSLYISPSGSVALAERPSAHVRSRTSRPADAI